MRVFNSRTGKFKKIKSNKFIRSIREIKFRVFLLRMNHQKPAKRKKQ